MEKKCQVYFPHFPKDWQALTDILDVLKHLVHTSAGQAATFSYKIQNLKDVIEFKGNPPPILQLLNSKAPNMTLKTYV